MLLNSQFANALGRPDQAFASRSASAPVTVVGGVSGSDSSPVTGGGRSALLMLMALIGAYAAFTWWVRPYLA